MLAKCHPVENFNLGASVPGYFLYYFSTDLGCYLPVRDYPPPASPPLPSVSTFRSRAAQLLFSISYRQFFTRSLPRFSTNGNTNLDTCFSKASPRPEESSPQLLCFKLRFPWFSPRLTSRTRRRKWSKRRCRPETTIIPPFARSLCQFVSTPLIIWDQCPH